MDNLKKGTLLDTKKQELTSIYVVYLSKPIPQQKYETKSNHRSHYYSVTAFSHIYFLHQIVYKWKSI